MNPLQLICRAQLTISHQYGNINPLSIAYATRLGLGPTNPGTITVAQETLLFRWAGFSPALWLLIPAFSLPHAPPDLTIRLQRREERSSTTATNVTIHIFGSMFSPVTFSAQGLLTSELLRTL
jgi:hypothetical protein